MAAWYICPHFSSCLILACQQCSPQPSLPFPAKLPACRHEQALVEAYAADGWRGASREKVKPVAEIKRAKEQVCVSVCGGG